MEIPPQNTHYHLSLPLQQLCPSTSPRRWTPKSSPSDTNCIKSSIQTLLKDSGRKDQFQAFNPSFSDELLQMQNVSLSTPTQHVVLIKWGMKELQKSTNFVTGFGLSLSQLFSFETGRRTEASRGGRNSPAQGHMGKAPLCGLDESAGYQSCLAECTVVGLERITVIGWTQIIKRNVITTSLFIRFFLAKMK